MVWDSLGTLSLTAEWQEFEISSLDDSLLRVRHEYNQRPLGYALLSSIFSDGSRGIFRRLYPFNDGSRLLSTEANSEFRQAGFNFRLFSLKIHPRTRFYDTFWKVTLEIWSDDVIADGGEGEPSGNEQIFDGGQDP